MKRIVVISLMFLYLITAIGLTVSSHYCDGKITSVSFNPLETEHKCSCGSKKMKKGCCKDETTTIKLSEEQQKTQQFISNIVKVADFQPAISTNLAFDYCSPLLSTDLNYNLHPPDDIKHPLIVRYRVFRI
jgi:hypothetical protein